MSNTSDTMSEKKEKRKRTNQFWLRVHRSAKLLALSRLQLLLTRLLQHRANKRAFM